MINSGVQSLSAGPFLPGAQLAVQSGNVEQNRRLLKGHRPLTAGQTRQRVVPKGLERIVSK